MRAMHLRVAMLAAGVVLLLLCMATSATIGAVRISPVTVLRMMTSRVPLVGGLIARDWPRVTEVIVLTLRLPRIALAAVIGGGLACAGASFQALFRNPMADPYVIGVSSGASLGATLAIIVGVGSARMGAAAIPLAAFAGGIAAVAVVYRISLRAGRVGVSELLLAGVAVSSLASSLVSLLMVMSTKQLDKVVMWLMGSLAGRTWADVGASSAYMLVGFAVVMGLARQLNAMLLGDEAARHLGVDVDLVKKLLLMAGSLMAASAVAAAGVIGFVGLIVPHIARAFVGPDHRLLLPGAALLGAIFLVASDAIARTVLAPIELPVGIVTALFGAPFFLYLLRRNGRGSR